MALSKKTKARLMKLVKFMESLPKSAEKHFNMAAWFAHDGDHELKYGRRVTRTLLKDCGTTACALGWAATIPYFKRLGLTVKHGGIVGTLVYRGEGGCDYEEIEECDKPLFGIDKDQWVALFGATTTVTTPQQWAARTRELIKQWEGKRVPA